MTQDRQGGLHGEDNQQRNHVDQDAGTGPGQTPEGLQRKRRPRLDRDAGRANVGRGNQEPPDLVPSPGQPAGGE